MSANLWKAENVISSEAQEGGIYACSGARGVRTNVSLDKLAANQTFHCGFSVNPGKDDTFNMALCYRDAAGYVNYAWSEDVSVPAGKWTRVSGSVVIPSGMTVYQMVICNNRNASGASGWKVTNPTLSLGSPVCLASSAHTPYATQDHISATYATKASLKVTDDSIKAEVRARAQTDSNVADLSSRLTQTANSLTSEISDRKTAITTVTGLANTAQSTADAAKSTVDGMKLGGRNLLKGTSMDSKAVTTPTTASTTLGSGFRFPADASLHAVIPYGAEYRCSVDVLLPVDGRIVVDMNTFAEVGKSWAGNDNDNPNRRTANAFNVKANVWTRISWGSENTNDANAGKQAIYVNDSVGLLPQSAAVTWHYRGLKVELGNKATDWTPAPEDTDSAVADAKKAGTNAQSTANSASSAASAAQHTADNAAKQANLYSFDNGAAGAVPKWIHLGTLTSSGDSSSATISIVFGAGYNGNASQNSKLTITIKDGYQNPQSATKACGVTAMRENCDDALVDVLAQSATVYDVWVYAPWAYSNGRYSISGQYAAWQHSGATQKDEPATSATQVKQDVAYRLADATKAQTMATENQSSIKQLSTSITAEVTARTKTDQMVSEVSSRLTQTADGFNASIDRLSDTDKKVNSWFGFGADASGNPQLTMGSSTSPVVGVYTNTGLAYQSRSGATLLELDGASRSSTMPHVHADDVSVGSWQWMPTQNGTHFTLQWIGG